MQKQLLDLINFGRHLTLSPDLAGLLQVSAKESCKLAGSEAGLLWSRDENPQALLLKARHPQRIKIPLSPLTKKSILAKLLPLNAPLFLSCSQVKRSGLREFFGVSRLAFLPIYIDGKPWGLLGLVGGKSEQFSEDEKLWLQAISERIENAIKIRLLSEQQAQLQAQISEVMSGFSSSLLLAPDPEDFLRLVCDIFLRLSRADYCSVWKLDDGRLRKLTACARSRRASPLTGDAAQSLAKKALLASTPQGGREAGGRTRGSALALPLKGRESNFGAITLCWQAEQAYNETEQNLLFSFAHYIALALEHLLLQQADKEAKAQLTELDQISRQLTTPVNSDKLLKTTLTAISRALHCPIVGVALLASDGTLQLTRSSLIGLNLKNPVSLPPVPGSILEQVLRRQSPQSLADAPSDPLGRFLRTKSLVCLALPGPEQALGALFVAHRKAHSFSPGELTLLSVYASKIALLLGNDDLTQGHLRSLDQLATLAEISRGFAASEESTPVLENTLAAIGQLLQMKCGLLLLKETAQGPHVISWGFDKNSGLSKILEQLEQEENLAALALQQQKVQTSCDLSRDGRFDYRTLARNGGPRAAIVAPLLSGGKAFGALCLYSWEERKFSDSEQRLLALMTNTLALALANRWHQREEKRRSAAYAELFREVNRQVRNNLQTIVALLEMSSAYPSVSTEEALRRTLQRIQCIHLIHSLFSSSSLKAIEVRQSTRQIAEMAQLSCGKPREEITVRVSGARILLSPQKAVSFSLAINELINNALTHGLKQNPIGHVQIDFSQSGEDFLIEVRDNGCGLPEAFDLGRDAGIGLKIVAAFVEQRLGGEFRLFGRSGHTIAQLRFPC